MYVVAGVSGRTGKVVAEQILQAGLDLRVIVREASKGAAWAERGAEVAVADLSDEAALTEALRGADAAYLLLPPDTATPQFLASRRRMLEAQVGAVRASGLPRLVYLSSVGAHLDGGTGPIITVHEAEQQLAWHPSVTFVRAAYFVENWGAVLGMVHGQGLLPAFQDPDQAHAMVCTGDIGRVAAEAMVDEDSPRVIELAGADDASPRQVAALLAGLLGRDVAVQAMPPEVAGGVYRSFGLSDELSDLYVEMLQAMVSGHLAWEHPETVRRGYTTVAEALAELVAG